MRLLLLCGAQAKLERIMNRIESDDKKLVVVCYGLGAQILEGVPSSGRKKKF